MKLAWACTGSWTRSRTAVLPATIWASSHIPLSKSWKCWPMTAKRLPASGQRRLSTRKTLKSCSSPPSGDVFAEPGIYTFMGYLPTLPRTRPGLHFLDVCLGRRELRLLRFLQHGQELNAKWHAEAERLNVKWILGGECALCGARYQPVWRDVAYNGPSPANMTACFARCWALFCDAALSNPQRYPLLQNSGSRPGFYHDKLASTEAQNANLA